jgi:hypothetical protein
MRKLRIVRELLADKLPESLTHLTLGEGYELSMDNLPANLTHLIHLWVGSRRII